MSNSRAKNHKGNARRSIHGSKRKSTRTTRVCQAPRRGQECPHCHNGKLDYDGLAQLSCPVCGYVAEGGGFT
jgi:uncharacterized protein (DUF983 family)